MQPPSRSCCPIEHGGPGGLAGDGAHGRTAGRLGGVVDAATGKVIKRYNRLVMDRGQVFDPAARQPGLLWRWAQTRPTLRTEELQGLDGSGWLRGEYVNVTQPEGYRPATAYSPSGDFRYSPDDPRFEEVMVYHYIEPPSATCSRWVTATQTPRPTGSATGRPW